MLKFSYIFYLTKSRFRSTDLTQENDKSFLAQFSENRDRFIIILGYHFAGSSCYNSDWKSLSLSWVIILQGQVVIILTGKSLPFFGLSFWRFTFFCEKRSIYHFAGFDSRWNSSYFGVIILQVRIICVSGVYHFAGLFSSKPSQTHVFLMCKAMGEVKCMCMYWRSQYSNSSGSTSLGKYVTFAFWRVLKFHKRFRQRHLGSTSPFHQPDGNIREVRRLWRQFGIMN